MEQTSEARRTSSRITPPSIDRIKGYLCNRKIGYVAAATLGLAAALAGVIALRQFRSTPPTQRISEISQVRGDLQLNLKTIGGGFQGAPAKMSALRIQPPEVSIKPAMNLSLLPETCQGDLYTSPQEMLLSIRNQIQSELPSNQLYVLRGPCGHEIRIRIITADGGELAAGCRRWQFSGMALLHEGANSPDDSLLLKVIRGIGERNGCPVGLEFAGEINGESAVDLFANFIPALPSSNL